MKKIQDIIEDRNKILHSTNFIDWRPQGSKEFGGISILKLKKSQKGGAGTEDLTIYKDSDSFAKKTEECILLKELVYRLFGCITGGHKISKNFKISKTGEIAEDKKS